MQELPGLLEGRDDCERDLRGLAQALRTQTSDDRVDYDHGTLEPALGLAAIPGKRRLERRISADWSGKHAPAFDAKTLEVLGVDEYLNRVYQNPSGNPVGLYIGYWGSQRQGDTMHSPLNCLPGSGWAPVSFNRRASEICQAISC